MLGARARAAEYNAAKAATARQKATRESEELRLPPRPAPISLSAFTRNASYSRNRGAKNFVPLILSEEEERSTSSTELASEADQTDSPQADPVVRPASLPPPQTLLSNSAEMDTNVQTPLRYTSPRSQMQSYPTTTRSLYHEDGYGFPAPSVAFHPHQYLPYQQAQPFVSHPNLIPPAPHIGWCTPGNYYSSHYSFHDVGVVPVAPHSEPRPQLHPHSLSQESATKPEPIKESPPKSTESNTRPLVSVDKLGGPTFHIFGPDDLSPSKMEIKQQARERYFANNPAHQSTPRTTRGAESFSASKPAATSLANPLTQPGRILRHNSVTGARHRSGSIQDLLIDHNSVAPVSVRKSSTSTALFSSMGGSAGSGPIELYRNTDNIWSTSDSEYLPRQAAASDGSPMRQLKNSKFVALDRDLGKTLFDMFKPKQEAGMTEQSQAWTTSTLVDSPRPQAIAAEPNRQDRDRGIFIKSLLSNPSDPQWCDFRGPSDEDRQRINMLKRAVATDSTYTREGSGLLTIKNGESQGRVQQFMTEYERRKKCVRALADEMKHKWEHGGKFRGPTMTTQEAEKYAGKIELIGHMMMKLSMLGDSRDSLYHLGFSHYTQPPEYAIERSVSVDKGAAASLFEQVGEEGRAAPPRLARDPRFRAQMNEALNVRGDEERIPRMFVARSRLQT